MRTRVGYALALFTVMLFAAPAWAERPEAGQGGIFVDEMAGLSFQWTDFDNDFLQVFWSPGGSDDFARETPTGKRYVHVMDEDVAISATVGGINFSGRGSYQSSYFANCTVFDPSLPAFNCFIGPGPASMNTHGTVTNLVTGQECTLSAHIAAFYLKQKPCDALFGAGSCSIGGDLIVASERQFEIKVTCAN